jgi:hypothetical protein
MTKSFAIWRFVIQFGLAKSGFWTETASNGDGRKHLIALRIIERDGNSALSTIVGPFSLVIGFVI